MPYDRDRTLVQGDRTPRFTCGEIHPLLEDARCERLEGHPGPHTAHLDTAATRMVVEWRREEARAG